MGCAGSRVSVCLPFACFEGPRPRQILQRWAFPPKDCLLFSYFVHNLTIFARSHTLASTSFTFDSTVLNIRLSRLATSNMPTSKFTEVLDIQYQSTSPQSDANLEDLIAASQLSSSSRGRTSSDGSSRSSGSSNGSHERTEENVKSKRLSRLFSVKR